MSKTCKDFALIVNGKVYGRGSSSYIGELIIDYLDSGHLNEKEVLDIKIISREVESNSEGYLSKKL